MTKSSAFADLGLPESLVQTLDEVGYESPSPIQARTIPPLLEGRDVIGRAQTGTGKTAAFALPILNRIDLKLRAPQALVLAPTRELAIQVAEAFQRYAARMPGFHVVPIYGGQSYTVQLKQLRRGVHVVVGTPGRLMDLMRKPALDLSALRTVVLDEADEMLRMGFIEDVEWILSQTPKSRQIALFSATMPAAVKKIAEQYLNDPHEVMIKVETATAASIRQRFWLVSGTHKLDALTRILEAEDLDGVIVFVRTKTATVELAEKLMARGYAAAALHGDVAQAQRELIVQRLKDGRFDILVATDVAARGLDIDRIGHVINYDVPYDPESYVHRIGRTGRAGRAGDAILFVAPRERRMLRLIERTIGASIEPMTLPTASVINDKRIERFHSRIGDALNASDIDVFRQLVQSYLADNECSAIDVAAALASIEHGDRPFLLEDRPPRKERPPRERRDQRGSDRQVDRSAGHRKDDRPTSRKPRGKEKRLPDEDMERFRIEVGHAHGVKPGNIVGAIANEAGLSGKHIGRVDIEDTHSFVDLPVGMPKAIFQDLKKVRVAGQKLRISRIADGGKPNQGRSGAPKNKGRQQGRNERDKGQR